MINLFCPSCKAKSHLDVVRIDILGGVYADTICICPSCLKTYHFDICIDLDKSTVSFVEDGKVVPSMFKFSEVKW